MGNSNQLQQALKLSEQILAAIVEQDLDSVARLDHERRNIIEKYYQDSATVDPELTVLLKQKNDQIVSRLIEIQQQTRSQQINLSHAQKVSKAYLDNA